jgi:hypothetical protein
MNEILSVIPDAVRRMAKAVENGQDTGKRLITDPRMKPAWTEMLKQARAAHESGLLGARFATLDPTWMMETWGVSDLGVSLTDRACAAFYCCVVLEVGVSREPMRRSDILELAERWRSSALLCRSAIHNPGVSHKPELAKALPIVAKYFDEYSEFISTQASKENPYLFDRDRGNTRDRALVQTLANGARAIFGSPLYRSLARVATAVTGNEISWQSVREWCSVDKDAA